MNFVKKNWLFLLAIMLLAILIFAKTGLEGLIDKTDINFPLFPIETFNRYLHIWDNCYLGVDQSIQQISKLPLFGIWALLNYIGFSAAIINRLALVGIFFMAGFSAYYLIWILLKGKSSLACFVGAIFFMFNPIVVINLLSGHMDILIVMGLMPLGLAYLIQAFESKNRVYIIYLILLSIFIFATNVTVSGLFYILVLAIFLYYLVTKKCPVKILLSFTLILIVGTIFVNIYWLLPFINKIFIAKENIYSPSDFFQSIVNVYNYISNNIRLIGFNPSVQYYPFMSFYSSSVFIFTSWALFLVIIINLFFKKTSWEIFLWILALIFIIFATGTNPPFGKIYSWLWDNLPGFNFYRDPNKWLIPLTIIYSIFIGYFIYQIKKSQKKLWYYILTGIVIILIFVNSAPLFSGNLKGWMTPIKIPNYYSNVKNWFESKNDLFNTWVLPRQDWYIKYPWSKYDLTDILNYLTTKPIVEEFSVGTPNKESIELIKDANDYIELFTKNKFSPLLALTGTKYVLLRNDAERFDHSSTYVEKNNKYYSFSELYAEEKKYINESPDLSLEKNLDSIDIYKIKDNLLLNHIYSPKKSYYFDGTIENLSDLVSLEDYGNQSGVYFANQNPADIINKTDQVIIIKGPEKLIGNKLINQINIPREGNYQIIIKSSDSFFIKNAISIDEKNFSSENIARSDGWIELGTEHFSKGEHKISIDVNTTEIPLDDYSFEKGAWDIIDASKNIADQPIFNAEKNTDATDGQFSIKLTSENHILGMRQKINSLIPGQIYNLSFDYKNSGGVPNFSVEFVNSIDNILGQKTDSLQISRDWQTENFIFRAFAETAYVYFYSQPKSFSEGVNFYDNVRLKQIATPVTNIALIENNVRSKNEPSVTMEKINETKYIVNIKNATSPYFLNLLESYNPEWQAKIVSNQKNIEVPNQNHYVANGFANAWYIDKSGDYQIIIEYWPQKLFYLGLIVSFAFVFFIIILLIIEKIKNDQKI